jgi:outer membrane receptor protein involved in Fe transport
LSGGGTLQLTHEGRFWERKNLLTMGAEYAHHDVGIRVFQEQNGLSQLSSDISDAQDTFGLYIQDTAELGRDLAFHGDSLVLTAALRYDYVRHDITDKSPFDPEEPDKENVTGVATFTRPTPRIGFNYNLSERYGVYFSYSEGFRAPAFLELTCSDPASPCIGLQAGVAPDTGFFTLRPVKARNYELGFRARPASWLEGSLAIYRTDVQDDIYSVSPQRTTIFFQNVGDTRREGIEFGLRGVFRDKLEGYVNYAYTLATFQSDIELASPRTPGQVEQVRVGDQLPLTPNHRINAGLRYHLHKWVALSLGLTYVSDQFFRGDEANTQPEVNEYVVLNAAINIQRDRFSGFVKINNLLNAKYETFGTFAANANAPGSPIEPFLTPAPPINVLVGASYRF